jgi:quinoprotein glucose dehydrogenase
LCFKISDCGVSLRLDPGASLNHSLRNCVAHLCFIFALVICGLGSSADKNADRDWPIYGGTPENDHFSPLKQINRKNVKHLQVAWTFDTEEAGGLQTSPVEVNGVLYGITPTQKIFAVDAGSGELLWKFDSGIKGTQPDRGLSYWSDGKESRIIAGVMNFVYALDAATGKPVPTFGKDGRIDLREGLARNPAEQVIYLTSPAVIYKDLMIVGGRESETLPASYGDIRAYEVRTGKLRWAFHTIPRPGEFGYDTWPKDSWKSTGAANNWTGMTLDRNTGTIYIPTGSAAFDFYGGDRLGDDLFANCLLALNAETGERIWHFQAVHHDLWDRDFPTPPILVTLNHDGQKVEALAQNSKQGFVFLFDRVNGKPIFPLECREYPPSDVPGEVAAKQQCLPTKPAPYARQLLTEDLLTNRTPQMHQWALDRFRTFRSEGQFVPFTTGKETVIFPGLDGGAEWGGQAVDPETGIMYVNANDIAWTGRLAKTTPEEAQQNSPKGTYTSQCSVCHGENMAGSPPAIPSLLEARQHLSSDQIASTIKNGKGRMPGFGNLSDEQITALVSYVVSGGTSIQVETKEVTSPEPLLPVMPYHFTGYLRFYDPDGYPAVAPPWGTLNAINLNTGEYVWQHPFGEYPELAAQGMKDTGTENYGGPLVTGGGLLFIGATNYDKKFHAFDKASGKLLWETTLPFAGNATPITYQVKGRQYVVIAAGGGKDLKSKSGGVYVAFAVPKK